MPEAVINQERLNDKIKLVQKVNYFSSSLAIIFSIICFFLLNIKEIIPYAFMSFGILNLLNTFLFKYHNTLSITYNITSVLALISTLAITLFSGGINSPFIFILALIVFAGHVTTRKYGAIYLNLILVLIILVYSQSVAEFSFTKNVVPAESQDLFSLCSVLFAVYLLGHVFGKNLLKTHHALYKSKTVLQKKIDEKETLLREVHHRVKNNLQTVSSLLSLQSRSIEDSEMKSIIKSSQNRVISMAMVHEMLYMRDDLSKIQYRTYVQELSDYLIRSLKGSDNNVKLTLEVPDINLGIDTAIPLGLLINEVITNALKYGIVEDKPGEITIKLKENGGQNFVLNIGDDGIGFPDTIDPKTTKSLGLKLIHNLARQLKGTIEKDPSKQGTNYIVKFSELNKGIDSNN